LSRGPSERPQGEGEADEPSAGLKPSDLLALPGLLPPSLDTERSGLLTWMTRQGQVTLAEVAAFLARDGGSGQDEEQARALLADLCHKGFVREIEIRGVTHYEVRLAPRRGRALPPDLWEALDGKVEQGGEEQR
jgi:hypothetical protein